MALPTSVNNLAPLGSASPATIDDQFRDLKLFLTDLFGVPNATNISANVMTVVAGGLDSINFANSAANAGVAGELQRNGANLTFHDGTSARTTVWAETTQTISGNKTFSAGVWNGTAVATQYGGTGQNFSGTAQGNTLYFSANGTMAALAPGTSGQFLKTQGAGANPTWDTVTVPAAANQTEMEAASNTAVYVSPGREQYHPGVAKVWSAIFWSSGTPTGEASYNVTSYTDNGAGDVTVNFTTAFSSDNYACVLGAGETDGNNRLAFLYAPSLPTRTRVAGSVRIALFSGGTGQDQSIQMACYGDQ